MSKWSKHRLCSPCPSPNPSLALALALALAPALALATAPARALGLALGPTEAPALAPAPALGQHAGEALQADKVVKAQSQVRQAHSRASEPFATRTVLTQCALQRASDVRAEWEAGVSWEGQLPHMHERIEAVGLH